MLGRGVRLVVGKHIAEWATWTMRELFPTIAGACEHGVASVQSDQPWQLLRAPTPTNAPPCPTVDSPNFHSSSGFSASNIYSVHGWGTLRRNWLAALTEAVPWGKP